MLVFKAHETDQRVITHVTGTTKHECVRKKWVVALLAINTDSTTNDCIEKLLLFGNVSIVAHLGFGSTGVLISSTNVKV
jgi:hypothetical protein